MIYNVAMTVFMYFPRFIWNEADFDDVADVKLQILH